MKARKNLTPQICGDCKEMIHANQMYYELKIPCKDIFSKPISLETPTFKTKNICVECYKKRKITPYRKRKVSHE
jgi:hypothetical protein